MSSCVKSLRFCLLLQHGLTYPDGYSRCCGMQIYTLPLSFHILLGLGHHDTQTSSQRKLLVAQPGSHASRRQELPAPRSCVGRGGSNGIGDFQLPP